VKCIDCRSFNMRAADSAAPGYAKLGMGKCDMKTHAPATFVTAAYARKCELFEKAADDVILKRIEWMEPKHA
jgi:hypothetical protein